MTAAADLHLAMARANGEAPPPPWPEPDMAVLRLHRRPPSSLPLPVFGPWATWITSTAEAAACPPDYVAAPLLASVSALIGNARWAQATPGWSEPPHLWVGAVGDSGAGKSPGADCLMRDVLPKIEAKMAADFPDQLREWRAAAEIQSAKDDAWKAEVRSAAKAGKPPPLAPLASQSPEPQQPRLRQNDVKVAELLGTAAPKGLLVVRDRQGETPEPVMVPLAKDARPLLETFGREMQERQTTAGGLLCSAYGKARGQALRLSLVLEFMWWCGEDGMAPPPGEITARAFTAAAHLLGDYFMPMGERVYGDAAIPVADRNAATLARWIKSKRPNEVHVRHLQREVRLPWLTTADAIHAAAAVLVEADWLRPRQPTVMGPGRPREAYAINPRLWEALQ
jgi:hypothetical protein